MKKILFALLVSALLAAGATAQTAPPVLAAIGAKNVDEGQALNFGVTSSDIDATIPVLSTSVLPPNATFIDNANGTGSFAFNPDFTQAGGYSVTFYAADAVTADIDSEIVSITVANINQSPVLAAIGAKNTTENILLAFAVSASDLDGTIPALTSSALPTGATYTDNGNGTASFSWTPSFVQAGLYSVTFYASDGVAIDSEVVAITVAEAGNQAPVLAAIGAKNTTENILLAFAVSASDLDGTIPALTSSALPSGAIYTDNGNGTASFSWTPSFVQAGLYSVTFYASDGVAIDSEVVAITVAEAGNQAPVLAAIGAKNTTENILLAFAVSASDLDGTIPALTSSALPSGAIYTDNGNGTASFSWTPSFVQAGLYSVTFYASDGVAVDSEVVAITVAEAGNQSPVLAAIGAKNTTENVLLAFATSATDIDGTIPALTSSALPTGATYTDNGNGTASFSWTPSFVQAGLYSVTFYASDGVAVDSEVVAITVAEAGNQAPVLAAIGAKSTTENVLLAFATSATDIDGTIPALTSSALPTGATYTDNGNGTASFSWTPSFVQAGLYSVTFYASDGVAIDSEVVAITVAEAGNQAPVLAAIGAKNTTENILLAFAVSASDLDGTIPALTSSALPSGAIYTDNGNGTASFSWTPSFVQAGLYSVTFYASDGVAVDSEVVAITVAEAGNQSPVLAAIGAKNTTENVLLAFATSATDIDGTIPALTSSALPTGATYTDNGNGTASFSWTPSFVQAGLYSVTFYASDGVAVDSEVVAITVAEAGNQSPVLAILGTPSTTETVAMTLNILSSDPDFTTPVLSSSAVPSGATFTNNGNGTAIFNWTPSLVQSGSYIVKFYAADVSFPAVIDSEVVTITVLDLNEAPVLASIGPKSVTEGNILNFVSTATDANGTTATITAGPIPINATFVDNGNGTGTFNFVPDFSQGGNVYNVLFVSTDGILSDSESVAITVNQSGNVVPAFTAINDTTLNENASLVLNISAVDPDGAGVFADLTINTTLLRYTFIDNNNGTATLTYSPNYLDAGADTVRVFATDNGTPALTATELFVITTVDVNRPPVFTPIVALSVLMNRTLTFNVSVSDSTDPVATNQIFLSAISLPPNATFTPTGNGRGTVVFSPNTSQIGIFNVNFLAVDEGTPSLSANLAVQITVKATNIPPVLAAIGTKTVIEGQTLTALISASDPDGGGTAPTLSAKDMPLNGTLTPTTPGNALFTFTPSYLQSGLYAITFEAFDGISIDKEVVFIQVYDAGNQAPVFDSTPAPVLVEGETVLVVITASDPDGSPVTLSAITSTLPANAQFNVVSPGVGNLSFAPTFAQAGIYNVLIVATDGTKSDTVTIVLTVNDAGNQLPILAAIGNKTGKELLPISFSATASDVDGLAPILTLSPLPTGATFTDNNNGGANFNWTPSDVQAGTYNLTIYAEDRGFAGVFDSEQIVVTIADTNRLPFIITSGSRTINEGDTLRYLVQASDPDGTIPRLRARLDTSSVATPSLLPGMTFVDSLNGKGVLTFVPNYTQGGLLQLQYFVRFYAKDGADTTLIKDATAPVQITVKDKNQLPILGFLDGSGPFTVAEGQNLAFRVTTTDPDGALPPSLTAQNVPANATFTTIATLGNFNFNPSFTQSGIYTVRFMTVDSKLGADTQDVVINVIDGGNQRPFFTTTLPDTINCTANALSIINVKALDPELQALIVSADPVIPAAAGYIDSGNGAATYYYTPETIDIGLVTQIRFIVTDPGLGADTIVTHLRAVAFLRGDIDANARYSVNDLSVLIAYLYRQGEEPSSLDAADVNADTLINIVDITYLIGYLFFDGPRPPQ